MITAEQILKYTELYPNLCDRNTHYLFHDLKDMNINKIIYEITNNEKGMYSCLQNEISIIEKIKKNSPNLFREILLDQILNS